MSIADSAADIDLGRAELAGPALHEFLHRSRAAGPIARCNLLGAEGYLLTRFGDVRGFLADLDAFPAGSTYEMQVEPTVGRTFISMDGADHDVYRSLAMPAFRSRPSTAFVNESLVPLAHEVIDRFSGRGEGDLVAEFTGVLPFWAISRKLGLPVGSEERQRRWALALLSHPVAPEAAARASAEVTAFLGPVMDERRRSPSADVLSHLLEAEHDGVRMTDDEVISHIRLLYAVGATTTSDAMSNLFSTLLTQPGLYELALSNPEIRPAIVHELLRWEPPVAILPRLAPVGGTIAGIEVAAGSVVLAAIAGANRDPEVFADADRFDPARSERDQITFGAGAKFCPGHHIARQQLEAALDVVLERLPRLRLVDADLPTGGILRSVKRLRVKWRT
jgi:cytochrome P450